MSLHAVPEQRQPRCACCDGPLRAAFAIGDINQRIGDREFHYGRCDTCAALQLEDPPDDLGAHYPASYYDTMDSALESDGARLADGQLEIFVPFVSSGRIIEVGPAEGGLLRAAARRGFAQRAAVERDARCCSMLREDGVEVVETADPVAGLGQLAPADAVVMFHVIEHVPDPMGLLAAAAAKVRPGGVLVVATPNPDSLSFKVCKRWWTHVEAPRHLFLLPRRLIADRAADAGLGEVRTVTSDPVGILCNQVAWTPWCHHTFGDRPGYYVRNALRAMLPPIERRGMHGSTYTVVFRRPA